jgi:anti-sigma-K factor RskA
MTEEEDIDGLAAEYVLGSLDASERRQVHARHKTDASLAAAIEAWERRLGPLSDRVPGVAPPAQLLNGILSRISAQAPPSRRSAEVIRSPRKTRLRWGLAVGASTLTACLALAVGWFIYMQSDKPTANVAEMDCSKLYKDFWRNLDPEKYGRISPEQLAGVSRMALRAYDACQAGDQLDAKALFFRLAH